MKKKTVTDKTESDDASPETAEHLKTVLEEQLEDIKQLQHVSNQIIDDEGSIDELYHTILRSAMEMMHADFASLQLFIPETKQLLLLVSENFHPDSAKFWQYVNAASTSTCGLALANNTRVILEDIGHLPFKMDKGDYDAYKLSGIVAVQSTPLISRTGKQVGMMSTHWKTVHTPSVRELGLYDIVARQVADLIERKKAEEEARKSDERYRTLFNSIDEGYCLIEVILDEQGKPVDEWFLEMNPAYKQHTGLPDSILGKRTSEIVPNREPEWLKFFGDVALTGKSNRIEYHVNEIGRWLNAYATRVGGEGSLKVAVVFNDVTERKQQEAALRESEEKYRSLYNSIDEGSYQCEVIFDEHDQPVDILYLTENAAAIRILGQSFVGKRLREINPLYEEYWYRIWGDVAITGISTRQEQYSQADGKWFDFFLSKIEGKDRQVIVLFSDITERKKQEEALRESEEKYRTLFNAMEEALAVCEVVRDDAGEVIDLTYLAFNTAHERQTGMDGNAMIGRKLSGVLTKSDVERFIPIYARVANTGEPTNFEEYVDFTGRWYAASVYPRGKELSIFYRDITERKQLEQRREFLLNLSDNLSVADSLKDVQTTVTNSLHQHFGAGWCYYVEWDEEKKAGVVLYDSKRDDLLSLAGTHDVSDVPEFLDLLRSGQILNVSDYANYELLSPQIRERYIAIGFRSMLQVSLVKQGRLISSLIVGDTKIRNWSYDDETLLVDVAERTWAAVERAKAEEALRGSEKRLQSIANLAPDLLWDSEPDGSTNWYNQRWLEYTGQRFEEAIGWGWVDAIHPDDREGSARRYAEAVKYGKPLRQEHRIKRHDGGYRWFVVNATPFKDQNGQVVKMYGAATDIHDRKLAEEALLESEEQSRSETARLQATLKSISDAVYIGDIEGIILANQPALDQLGYSTFDELKRNIGTLSVEIQTRDAETNEIISPERQAFARALNGESVTQSVRVRMLTDGTERIVRSAAAPVVVDGKIIAAVAVNTDITEQWKTAAALRKSEQKLREFNESLEQQVKERTAELAESRDRQQREIFEVTLSTLEEERHRISESLHNGLGQVLYGVKISLENLKRELPEGEFDKTRAYTGKLVSNAIQEARRISHELMPTILEEFGLRDAISDIAHQLQDGVKFKFRMTGQKGRLEKYLELAVYRTVQELMTNVVKHANATEASVNINAKKNEIIISVSDNGQGIGASKAEKTGIGLASIRSKIKLLNGNVNIISVPGMGTHIEVIIPRTGGS